MVECSDEKPKPKEELAFNRNGLKADKFNDNSNIQRRADLNSAHAALETAWRPRLGLVVTLSACIALLACTLQALARMPSDDQAYFNIPAQPLEMALKTFAAQSRLQVLYETSMTEGRRSSAVRGVSSREAALRKLLEGTGLAFTYTEKRAFTLVVARPRPARPISDFYPYLGLVQARLISALCRNGQTRPGAFRVALRFHIGPSGRLDNPVLLNTTGAQRRDAAITAILADLNLNAPPPADMPQPVTMVLAPGAADGSDECPPEGRR